MSYLFNQNERDSLYRIIGERRDMRHFTNQPITNELLKRLLDAAHQAPSVGYMQPWRFIRITDLHIRQQLQALVEQERVHTAHALNQRSDEFMRLKVEGILDCAEVLVTSLCDQREQHIFGRRTLPEMDLASVACAIQNMWLAARAENIGLGWVSLFDPEEVKKLLGMPEDSKPVAILCLGHVDAFYDKPMLEQEHWAKRLPLEELVFENRWPTSKPDSE